MEVLKVPIQVEYNTTFISRQVCVVKDPKAPRASHKILILSYLRKKTDSSYFQKATIKRECKNKRIKGNHSHTGTLQNFTICSFFSHMIDMLGDMGRLLCPF